LKILAELGRRLRRGENSSTEDAEEVVGNGLFFSLLDVEGQLRAKREIESAKTNRSSALEKGKKERRLRHRKKACVDGVENRHGLDSGHDILRRRGQQGRKAKEDGGTRTISRSSSTSPSINASITSLTRSRGAGVPFSTCLAMICKEEKVSSQKEAESKHGDEHGGEPRRREEDGLERLPSSSG
jgi:hypothetical protein